MPRWLLAATLLAFAGLRGHAQEPPPPVAGDNSNQQSEVPKVPGISGVLRGANAGLTLSGIHDASTGWSTVWQPAFSYTFNETFAIDVTIPIYMYRLTQSDASKPKPNALLIPERGERGDTVIGLHAQFAPRAFDYDATVSVTAPTGDEAHGLSTGRATFDLSNLFEHSFSFLTPNLELGVGDSTALINRLVTKNYTSLGPLAHFSIGTAFPLLHGISLETSAYELLPIGDQKIYQSVTRRGTTTFVVTGHNVTEDNGFNTSLDIPLDRHTTLSTYYSRSLRQRDDIVSIGLTYVLRGSPAEKHTGAPAPLATGSPDLPQQL